MTLEPTRTDLDADLIISEFAKKSKTPSGQGTGQPEDGGKPRLLKSQWVPDAGPQADLWKKEQLDVPQHPIAFALRRLEGAFSATAAIVFEGSEVDGDTALVARHVLHAKTPALYRGMRLRGLDFADIFNRLSKFGFIEFAPLGLSARGNFDRAAFRSAFGLETAEWLTLVRLGADQPISSLVAFFSPESIQAQLPAFHAACIGGAPSGADDATRAVG